MLHSTEFERIANQSTSVTPIEVKNSPKAVRLLLEINHSGGSMQALFYPEKGIKFSIDTRIPKPWEAYHQAAYYQLAKMLGWKIAIPTVPFSLDADEKGVLSPYFTEATTQPHYFYESITPNTTWLQIAALDYIAGLVDRTSNDILWLPNDQVVVTDNGLSFVEGVEFSTQISVIRKAMRGICLPAEIMQAVSLITAQKLDMLSPLLFSPDTAIQSIIARRDRILAEQQVL